MRLAAERGMSKDSSCWQCHSRRVSEAPGPGLAGVVDSADCCIGAKRFDLFGYAVTDVFLQEV